MGLITYEGFTITVAPEALLIKNIRKLWQRDRSKSKEKALLELGYIYFMVDPRSDYDYIDDLEDRAEIIITEEGMPKNWKPDKVVLDAMESYSKTIPTTSSLLLKDTKVAINKLRDFLINFDFEQLDDKGKPVYTINTITSAIKMIPTLAKDLADAERIVTKEILENNKMRGQKEKNILEDGFTAVI